jgi:hypothetical protein
VNEETIEDIWRSFTENNRSFDGKVNKSTMIKVFMNKLACSKKENKLCIMNEHIIEVYFLFYLRLFLKDLNLNLVQIKKKKLTFKI